MSINQFTVYFVVVFFVAILAPGTSQILKSVNIIERFYYSKFDEVTSA